MCTKCGGSSSSGGCTDCTKVKAKTPRSKACEGQYTGDLLYDGTALSCAADADFTVEVNDNPNNIIAAFYEKLCILSEPVLYATSNTSEAFSASMAPISDCDITIVRSGTYTIIGVLNYSADALNEAGYVSLMNNGTEIAGDAGLRKTIKCSVPSGNQFDKSVATVLYKGDFTAGDVIQIGIQSTTDPNNLVSLGGQLIVTRVLQ
jgi:hypothetical protein